MKRNLLIGVAGGALALAIAGGGLYARPLLASSTSAAQSTAASVATPQPQDRAAGRRPAAKLAQGLIKITADVTGVAPKDVVAALQGGQSLSQFAQSKGKTDADVIGAARSKLDERLKAAVSGGKLTQAQADARLKAFDAAAPQIIANQRLGAQLANKHHDRRQFGAALVKATASVTGTDAQDVRAALKGGQSLAQYAQTHGKTADDIIAKLREQGEARLATMLEQAKQLLNKPGLGSGGQPGDATATPAE